MFRKLPQILLMSLALLVTGSANAGTITFEDGAYTGNAITSGYQGFQWSNMYAMPGADLAGTGYENGIVSGTTIAFNGSADPASFWRAETFSLMSIEVTKAWTAGISRFEGFSGGALLYSMDVFSTTLAPTHVVFNWHGIDKVTVSDPFRSFQTVVDDIVIGEVPEPSILLLFLLTLPCAIAWSNKKSRG
jgi:hypothetical protein